jgi:peptidoglycan/xylan/chitin deacetylase (PgdA/CDA1 family)
LARGGASAETILSFKRTVIGAGFAAMRATGLHRAMAAPGLGFILTLHRVRPFAPPTPGYAPNRLLEVTPEFFDAALSLIAARGFEFVTLAEAARRLAEGGPPFAALTFDDGYRDTRDVALAVLERHGAPATVFFAPGLIERTARLWWLELEEAIRRLDAVDLALGPNRLHLPARSPREKSAAFERVYWTLRARPEADLLDAAAALAAEAGVGSAEIAEPEFLTWDETLAFARHPLVAVGAHSLSHRRLAQWPAEVAREELAVCKAALEARLGAPVTSFAYPVGDATSAGPREFALAREAGYEIAVTTRPGMLFPEHARHLLALPRVSLNGLWQNLSYLEVLLTGAPFLLWNRGRRLNVA